MNGKQAAQHKYMHGRESMRKSESEQFYPNIGSITTTTTKKEHESKSVAVKKIP